MDGCLEVILCCTIIDIHAFMCGCRRFKQFMQEGVLWVRGVGVSIVWVGRVNVALCVQGVRGPAVVARLPCLGLFDHWWLKLPDKNGWGSWSAWDCSDASCGKIDISVNGRFRYLVHNCVCM